MKTSGEQAYCKCETTEVCSCMSSGCTTAWEAWDTETDGLLFACTLFPNTTKVTSKVQSYVSTSWRTMKGDRLCQDAKQYEMFVRRMCFTKCCVKDVEFAVLRFARIILSFLFDLPKVRHTLEQGFLRCFRDPIRVPRIRENYRQVPSIRENRVPTVREIGPLPLAYGGGGHCAMTPPQILKIKKCINSMRIFRCKCVFLGVICVILGGILQNFPGGVPPDPPTMVVLKLIYDVTQWWRNLVPPGKFSAYATGPTGPYWVPSIFLEKTLTWSLIWNQTQLQENNSGVERIDDFRWQRFSKIKWLTSAPKVRKQTRPAVIWKTRETHQKQNESIILQTMNSLELFLKSAQLWNLQIDFQAASPNTYLFTIAPPRDEGARRKVVGASPNCVL